MSNNNELPSLKILGSVSIASGFPRTITQNSFVFSDTLSFVRGRHARPIRRSGHTLAGQCQPGGTGIVRAVPKLAGFFARHSVPSATVPHSAMSSPRSMTSA